MSGAKTLRRLLSGTSDAAQREGNNAKPYQVKAVRAVILKYKLGEAE